MPLDQLPLTFPVQSDETVAYFNRVARSNDIALVPSRQASWLPQITRGRKMVVFASWAEAEQQLDGLRSQVDIVAYNPEHWDQTPTSEQQNLVATVQRASAFASARGLPLLVAPDRQFATQYAGQIAPYADGLLLQGQRLQDDPKVYAAWIRDTAASARAGKAGVLIYAQVSLAIGTATVCDAAARAAAPDVNGISVWSSPSTFDALQAFVDLIR